MDLDKKRVVITGGGSGLGLATAHAVRSAGGLPVVFDLEPGTEFPGHRVDVTDREAVETAVEAVAADLGGIDAVVAAAGIDIPGDLEEVTAAQWEKVLAVNLLGTVHLARAALLHLRLTHGRVVTVASTLAFKGAGGATAYCASKWGVRGFSQALAAETAGAVGVTNLVPGGMNTRFFDGRSERFMPQDDSKLNDPARVADAIVFALGQPTGVEVRELFIAHELEDSWP